MAIDTKTPQKQIQGHTTKMDGQTGTLRKALELRAKISLSLIQIFILGEGVRGRGQ